MFPNLKPSTTLMVFVLLYISTSCLEIVKAAPPPTLVKRFGVEHYGNGACNSTVDQDIKKQNALDAEKLNESFRTMKATDQCQDGQTACIFSQFAECKGSQWTLRSCPSGTSCLARALTDKPGTRVGCDIPNDLSARNVSVLHGGGEAGGGCGGGVSPSPTSLPPSPNDPTSDLSSELPLPSGPPSSQRPEPSGPTPSSEPLSPSGSTSILPSLTSQPPFLSGASSLPLSSGGPSSVPPSVQPPLPSNSTYIPPQSQSPLPSGSTFTTITTLTRTPTPTVSDVFTTPSYYRRAVSSRTPGVP